MVGFLRLVVLATALATVTTISVSAAEIHVMSGDGKRGGDA